MVVIWVPTEVGLASNLQVPAAPQTDMPQHRKCTVQMVTRTRNLPPECLLQRPEPAMPPIAAMSSGQKLLQLLAGRTSAPDGVSCVPTAAGLLRIINDWLPAT